MKLLASAIPEPELAAFYADLLASEARHHTLYVDLAAHGRSRAEVEARLAELALHEAEVIATAPAEARLHSAGR